MERFHIAVVVAVTLVVIGGLPADSRGSRWKRQAVRIISNESVPCEQLELTLTKQNGGTPPRHIQLNDDDKKRLMRMRGFDFQPSIMASSDKDGTDIVDILQPTQLRVAHGVGVSTRTQRAGSGNDRPLSRSEILARLRTNRNARSAAASGTTADQRNENDAPTGAQNLPYVLPEDIGINRTIAQFTTEDFIVTIDYCIARTTPMQTIDGAQYLRMCTACATTTSTSANFWPSLLYGAVCNAEDNSCLYEGTVSYGRCLQSTMPVTLLRKSMSSCVLVLENGQKVLSEDWLPFTYYIGIGCECAVAEQSQFR